MPKVCYQDRTFSAGSMAMIDQANAIISEYEEQGFDLTLRQLYYQFVSRDLIANRQTEYKRLGSVINDARLAGLIDWLAIVDRTRYVRSDPHWRDPSEMVGQCAKQFHVDMWVNHKPRPEVWIEKDALVGVIDSVCRRLDVPFFSCRGYTSQSEMWMAARRMAHHIRLGQVPTILHLGDHNPSGVDMSRDIEDRLAMFLKGSSGFVFHRIALNMDQIDRYKPPPNPAKLSDSRSTDYVQKFGSDSWELDALDPRTLSSLIEHMIEGIIDTEAWEAAEAKEKRGRRQLLKVSQKWAQIVDKET